MHRAILPIFLYASVASSAPQDSGDISHLEFRPLTKEDVYTGTQLRESRIETLDSNIPDVDAEQTSQTRSDDATSPDTETPEPAETVTDNIQTQPDTEKQSQGAPQPVTVTEAVGSYKSGTRAPSPRFFSKLSYFQKAVDIEGALSTNLVDLRHSNRKFKSKCRCEKIWNCPKLQISVPRCPNEYFMCCF